MHNRTIDLFQKPSVTMFGLLLLAAVAATAAGMAGTAQSGAAAAPPMLATSLNGAPPVPMASVCPTPAACASTTATLTPGPALSPLTEQSVEAKVAAMTSINSSITSMSARETTWGTLVSVDPLLQGSASQVPLSTHIWIVAVTGTIHPQFAPPGTTKDWAIYRFDATTGLALGMEAGMGSLPGFLPSIPNIATAGGTSS